MIGEMGTRLARGSHKALAMLVLHSRNVFSRARVTGSTPVVVSLTTYGARLRQVHLTIESIGRGAARPARLILWLDDAKQFERLPRSLQRLRRRGLEVKLSANYGPHTKYLPYVMSESSFEVPLATADDDTIYPTWWLQRLYSAWSRHPENVLCYRARVLTWTDSGSLATYLAWPEVRTVEPKLRHFALGVSGAMYPLRMLRELRRHGDSWDSSLRNVDDIWLHAVAVSLDVRIEQVEVTPHDFPLLLSSQGVGLRHSNLDGGNNDRAARVAYSSELTLKMRSEG